MEPRKTSSPDKPVDVTVVFFPGTDTREANLQLEENISKVAQDPNLNVNFVGVITGNPATLQTYGVDPAHKGPVAVVVRKMKRTVILGPGSPEELRKALKGEKP